MGTSKVTKMYRMFNGAESFNQICLAGTYLLSVMIQLFQLLLMTATTFTDTTGCPGTCKCREDGLPAGCEHCEQFYRLKVKNACKNTSSAKYPRFGIPI